jgi:hypothetical protein
MKELGIGLGLGLVLYLITYLPGQIYDALTGLVPEFLRTKTPAPTVHL